MVTQRLSLCYLFFGSFSEQVDYVTRTKGAVQTLAPVWLNIGNGGALDSSQINPTLVTAMHNIGVQVIPVLSNHYDRANNIAALANTATLTTQLANLADTYEFDGIQVDLENLTPTQKTDLTTFVQTLKSKLSAGKELSVAVAANPYGYTTDVYGAYDYAALAQHADYLAIMTYDESYEGSAPGPVTSLPFMTASLNYALITCGVAPQKIVLGLPFYGRIWGVNNALFTGEGLRNAEIMQLITDYGAVVTFDDTAKSAKAEFTVTSSSPTHTVEGVTIAPGQYVIWFENPQAYEAKLALVRQYDLLGVAAWALGQEDPNIWNHYKEWLNGPTYQVAYQANWPQGVAGTGSVPTDSQEYQENSTVTVLANTNNLARLGYRFLGWDQNPNAILPAYAVEGSTVTPSTFVIGTTNVVLYAVWRRLYSVIYEPAYPPTAQTPTGSAPIDENWYEPGQILTLKTNTNNLGAQNYVLTGWLTQYQTSTGLTQRTSAFNKTTGNISLTPTITLPANIESNITIRGTWNACYQVSYQANFPADTQTSGSAPIDSAWYCPFVSSYWPADTVTVLANPNTLAALGYRFLGWDPNPQAVTPTYGVSGSTVTPSTFVMGAANVVLYAVWQRVFSVHYEAGFPPQAQTPTGTTPIDSNGYAPGETLTVLPNTGGLGAVNYALIGWQTSYPLLSAGTFFAHSFFERTTGNVTSMPTVSIAGDIAGDILLTGLWVELYSVQYDANFPPNTTPSGTAPVDPLWYSPYIWGGWPADTVIVLGNVGGLAAGGYVFLGWDPNPKAITPVYGGGSTFSQPNSAQTLFAIWKQTAYRVVYQGNGAEGGSVPVDLGLYEEAQPVTVLANLGGLTRTGYRLLGWSFSALAEVPDFGLFGSVVVPSGFSMPNSEVELFAVWEPLELPPQPETFTVTYHANFPLGTVGTGTVPLDNHSYPKGSSVTLLANIGALALVEHRLLGWSILPNASMPMFEISGVSVLPPSFHIGANVVFYAVWQLVVVPPVCGDMFDGTIFDWTLFDVEGTPSGSGDLFDGELFDCQIFDVPCPSIGGGDLFDGDIFDCTIFDVPCPSIGGGDLFDGDIFDCTIFDVPCPPEPPKRPYVYGDLDYVKMLTKLNVIDSIQGENREHHNDQLILALVEANFWIVGRLLAAGAEEPYKAPDMLHHIASHYAAGTFLERDQALNEVHHWKQNALDMMEQYLAAAYGLDEQSLVDLQPSIVVIGNRYGTNSRQN